MPTFSRDLEKTLSRTIPVASTPEHLNDTATAAMAAVATLNHCFIASREV